MQRKTSKRIKRVGVLLFSCVSFIILSMYNFNPFKTYTNADFNISTYVSPYDQDQDGMDDQSDILSSVRTYIATKPKYQSKYYGTGYPDDEYGVCTDVVAFGLLGSGYDLMMLVNNDVKARNDVYKINTIDKKIDFRRVNNLKIFFDEHALSLTIDVHDIHAWQGGDIIVFKKHIGVVSDKRNKKGIPYVIHHGSPYQLFYEEDILEQRSDIIGHYRIKPLP
ncbi:MAG: DUF1287 domain-containing protein [Erysipelotrichia bacterium]|nr:DUF1287 domain-containing protein [Erysipelotrichia bacterium]